MLVAFGLIAAGLLASNLSQVYYRYRELQRERDLFLHQVSRRAVQRIQRFLRDTGGAMEDAAFVYAITRDGPGADIKSGLDRLLAEAPAIASVMLLDQRGRVRSRSPDSFADSAPLVSHTAAFLEAKQGVHYLVRFISWVITSRS